jgi:hypothetical protein
LGVYSLNLSTSEGVILVEALGGDSPFGSAPTANMVDGGIIINAFTSESQGPQMNDLLVARMQLRLNATAGAECTIEPYDLLVADASSGVEYDTNVLGQSLSFIRGDVNKDGHVGIADAMFIAQYLAGNRDASDLNLLNAASIKQDESDGDKITIADAMFIAQYLTGLRDENFNLKG